MTVHFFNNLLAFLPQIDINAPVDSSPITSSDATTSIISGLILFLIGFKGITEKMNKKDDKIWQLESEIVELKEQIHILEMKEE